MDKYGVITNPCLRHRRWEQNCRICKGADLDQPGPNSLQQQLFDICTFNTPRFASVNRTLYLCCSPRSRGDHVCPLDLQISQGRPVTTLRFLPRAPSRPTNGLAKRPLHTAMASANRKETFHQRRPINQPGRSFTRPKPSIKHTYGIPLPYRPHPELDFGSDRTFYYGFHAESCGMSGASPTPRPLRPTGRSPHWELGAST